MKLYWKPHPAQIKFLEEKEPRVLYAGGSPSRGYYNRLMKRMMNMDSREKLELRRDKLIDYLKMKTEEGDWHGVADAAMDLREVDAKLSMIKD